MPVGGTSGTQTKMIERLRSLVAQYRPRKRESDGPYDGPLSIYAEWHSLLVGVAVGLVTAGTGTWELAVALVAIALGVRAAGGPLEDIRREPWYACAGLVFTYPPAALLL